ncbi:MAG: response regulator [Ginsengibacter sp.]
MKENIILLIVDDDEDDRQLFIESAREVDENITCISAGDGIEALEILRNKENELPDYIFLDLRMPRFNGKKCLEEIRKDTRLLPIPVIIYTTSRQVEDAVELKKMGAAHFISKPVNPEEIYYLISSVIEEKWTQM